MLGKFNWEEVPFMSLQFVTLLLRGDHGLYKRMLQIKQKNVWIYKSGVLYQYSNEKGLMCRRNEVNIGGKTAIRKKRKDGGY